jgi:hypothetical protein
MWETINSAASVIETWTSLAINLVVIGVAVRLRMQAAEKLDPFSQKSLAHTFANTMILLVLILLWAVAGLGVVTTWYLLGRAASGIHLLTNGHAAFWGQRGVVIAALLAVPAACVTIYAALKSLALTIELIRDWRKPF